MFGFVSFLHVMFSLCISTPGCKFVYSILLYITYQKYLVCKAAIVSDWVLRTLFGSAKIILSKNYSSISDFFVSFPIKIEV